MLFSELAKRVAEKYPEVKTAYPMDCELSNVELYDPSGAVPPVDSLSIYTARQISQDMTLPLCFVCAGTPDQAAHDKIAYSDSNYIIIPQVSVVDVVYYIMSLFGDSFKQQKLYSNLIYMLLNGADLTSVFCEFSKGTGSQLLAIDISGKVLAYSKPFRVNHPHWIHSIEVGYLDNYLIEYILSYRVKHKMDMSPNTFVLFQFHITGDANNTVTYWPYSRMDRFILSHLRGIANKTAYCFGCKACEVQCPVNAFTITETGKIYIREDKCVHCCNCIEFTNGKGCLAAKSLSVTGGENGMDLKGMNRYQHFGLRRPWLEHFFEHKENCFTMGSLGTRQYDSLKVWLKEAGLLTATGKGVKSGVPTPLFDKIQPLGAGNPLTWAVIWTTLSTRT